MVMRNLLCFLLTAVITLPLAGQNYPVYGPEVKVYISGWATDAMEPFISPDGSTLFFNSLNSGGDTKLYYASRIDDSTFTYAGEVGGANEPANPQLNAVASLDTTGNFVWVSARSWPAEMDNLHRADYSNGVCSNVNRVHGNFYVYQPGYIIMDAGITYDGSQLYYCNAFFDSCVVPCTASLGIASRVNDSTFNTIANSAAVLQHVNDTGYCVYAPQLSSDGLELYFTRFLIGGLSTEICVSVRNSPTDTFSIPQVLITEFPNVPEAASVNTQMTLMYYHKKINGTYAIHLRQRITTGMTEGTSEPSLRIFPNPASEVLQFSAKQERIELRNATGQLVATETNSSAVNISHLPEGVYAVHAINAGISSSSTFVICR